MPAYVVVDISVNDPGTYERYKTLAPDSIAAHGGRYLARGGAIQTLEGDWCPSRLVILEFPDPSAARAWWASDDYATAKSLRQASASSRMVLLEGLPVP